MMTDLKNRGSWVAAAVMSLMILGLGSGCMALRNGGPVAPYRPLAKPMTLNNLRTAPASTRETATPVMTTNALPRVEADNLGRTLRSGDRLVVTIHAAPEPFSAQHVVDEQGRINLPYIGAVPVAAKSCAQAQKDIEKEYIDQKYYKTVTVIIVPPESEYSVSGEVLRPGPYPLTRNLTVLQALARAGRFTEYADKTRIRLIRGSEVVTVNAVAITDGKQKDITIIPGDVIEVPRTWY